MLNNGVSVDEVLEAHESTADANDKLIIHNLGVNLSRTEHVEAGFLSADGNIDFHRVDVLGEQFIDGITRGG